MAGKEGNSLNINSVLAVWLCLLLFVSLSSNYPSPSSDASTSPSICCIFPTAIYTLIDSTYIQRKCFRCSARVIRQINCGILQPTDSPLSTRSCFAREWTFPSPVAKSVPFVLSPGVEWTCSTCPGRRRNRGRRRGTRLSAEQQCCLYRSAVVPPTPEK